MSTYRNIADSEVAENAPVTTLLMGALRDNLEAVLEGDPSAPKVSTPALEFPPVGSGDSYQNVSGLRQADTAYQNTTGQSIEVCVHIRNITGNVTFFQISKTNVSFVTVGSTDTAEGLSVTMTVGDGEYYKVTVSAGAPTGAFLRWAERRP